MPWIDLPANYKPPGFRASLSEPKRWFEFRNAADDEAELLIFDEVGGWFGVYADEFVEALNAVTASRLTVRVNSPGGSVFQGVAIANALRAHPARVTVRVEGLAASIASVIALAGDRLIMAPNSMFMIHDASGGCWGQASDMQKMAEILDKISDNIADAYAAKAGGTRAEWRSRMLAETWYNAEEAVEAGLADELVTPQPSEDPDASAAPVAAKKWDLSVFQYAGRAAAPAPVIDHVEPARAPVPEPRPAADDQPTAEHDVPADETTTPDVPAPADDWADLTAHLTEPPSEVDEWESLREALL